MKNSRAAALLLLIACLPTQASTPVLNWYRGNTHVHTNNSDGHASPDTVARWYKENGYQFLFITDHEYITDPAPLNALFGADDRFLVLPGQEITQWSEDSQRPAAHVNSLFTTEVIWPIGARKCTVKACGAHADASLPLADAFRSNIVAIRAANGIAQINHPNYQWSVKPEDLHDTPDGTLIEIWNGQSHINNLGGTDELGDARPSAESYWDILLSRGNIVWGVAADDRHDFKDTSDRASRAWIVVRAPELTSKAIETSLRNGDFYASTGITLSELGSNSGEFTLKIDPGRNLQRGPRYLTKFIGKDGVVLAEVPGLNPAYKIKGSEGYIRASILDSNGLCAWSQPVFIKPASSPPHPPPTKRPR